MTDKLKGSKEAIEVEQIYHSKDSNRVEVIYQLSRGIKVIKRSDKIVKKLNIEKWEEVSFVPENFKQVNRNITPQEEEQLKAFLIQSQHDKQSWQDKLKSIWQSITNLFKK
ncbi:hypothetical protein MWH28_10460 [Natroniella sulfidigena]|uniref:hypothetical protein n=1 Tax=Natroniella sulfidigena TaxID=723921 RepID=UPI00200AD9E2|nr:hypothetical protein [Natroniella sulfidigena]MCK8817783.1 hypothetical protein [Natroniella sulfidigena]